jgi:hypothetical protein
MATRVLRLFSLIATVSPAITFLRQVLTEAEPNVFGTTQGVASTIQDVQNLPSQKKIKPNQFNLPRSSIPSQKKIKPNDECGGMFDWTSITHVRTNEAHCIKQDHTDYFACEFLHFAFDLSKMKADIGKGGEAIEKAMGISEEAEYIQFAHGSVVLPSPIPQEVYSVFPKKNTQINERIRSMLKQAVTKPLPLDDGEGGGEYSAGHTAMLVMRQDYANPCMAIAELYGNFVAARAFGIDSTEIVFIDAHPANPFDEVWAKVFQKSEYVLRMRGTDGSVLKRFSRVVIVGHETGIHDKGLRLHSQRGAKLCHKSSLLHLFASHVLKAFNVERQAKTKHLTLLYRADYTAHPRSDGLVDRAMVEVDKTLLLVQQKWPGYTATAVRFENISFAEQLAIMSKTEVLLAVHGAGNIHTLFLPPGASLFEFFPAAFGGRTRFRFLSQAVGVEYHALSAKVVATRGKSKKISVDIQAAIRGARRG